MTKHVLFLCSQNRLRSPTAEQVFADWPGIVTSSAGLNKGADTPLTPELPAWADLVFVMERALRSALSTPLQVPPAGTADRLPGHSRRLRFHAAGTGPAAAGERPAPSACSMTQ